MMTEDLNFRTVSKVEDTVIRELEKKASLVCVIKNSEIGGSIDSIVEDMDAEDCNEKDGVVTASEEVGNHLEASNSKLDDQESQTYKFEDYWKHLIPEIEKLQKASALRIESLKYENCEKVTSVSTFIAEESKDADIDFLKTMRIGTSHPCVTERFCKPQMFGEDSSAQCVLIHSNRLQIVTISPFHPIIVNKKTVISVVYENSGNVNRLKNKVSGKFKRGGQKMKENSRLCTVKCSDDSEYTFISCVRGTLIEVNERLINQPSLLYEKPWAEGYIAIILPIFSRPKK